MIGYHQDLFKFVKEEENVYYINMTTKCEQQLDEYKYLCRSLPDAMIILNGGGKILMVSERLEKLSKYSEKELIEKKIFDLPHFPKKYSALIKENLKKILAGKKVPLLDVKLIIKTGEEIFIEINSCRINFKEEKAILIIVRDITEQKRIEKDLIVKSNAIELSINAIGFADLNGKLTYVNPSFLKLWGYENEKEVLGKATTEFWEMKQKAKEVIKALNKKGGWIGELVAKRKDGSLFDVGLAATMVKDVTGEPIARMASFIDITEQKKIDRAKTEFISLASHQLRTPLTTMNWYLEVLLSEKMGKFNTKQKNYLKEVYTADQRLVKLVNALLNVSRIELGILTVELKPINFIKISDSVLNEFLEKIKDKQLRIEKSYDKKLPIINTDPHLIRIIFYNLLSNAVQYTPKKSRVSIEIRKQKSDILIKVADTGYGIPKAQQSKIFEKLFRADNIKQKEPDGTGLGLYIVKAVVEQSDGKIWFESVENKGSTFYVTIPLKGMKKKKGTRRLT